VTPALDANKIETESTTYDKAKNGERRVL